MIQAALIQAITASAVNTLANKLVNKSTKTQANKPSSAEDKPMEKKS